MYSMGTKCLHPGNDYVFHREAAWALCEHLLCVVECRYSDSIFSFSLEKTQTGSKSNSSGLSEFSLSKSGGWGRLGERNLTFISRIGFT